MFVFSISVSLPLWCILYFLGPQSCMLKFGREFFRWLDSECVWGWRTMHPTCTQLVFLSDALQRLSFWGRIYIFHSIICCIIFLMTETRIHVFSLVCIPECFLTALSWWCLILFGIAIINYLQSPCHSLSDLYMLLLGRYVSCWC